MHWREVDFNLNIKFQVDLWSNRPTPARPVNALRFPVNENCLSFLHTKRLWANCKESGRDKRKQAEALSWAIERLQYSSSDALINSDTLSWWIRINQANFIKLMHRQVAWCGNVSGVGLYRPVSPEFLLFSHCPSSLSLILSISANLLFLGGLSQKRSFKVIWCPKWQTRFCQPSSRSIYYWKKQMPLLMITLIWLPTSQVSSKDVYVYLFGVLPFRIVCHNYGIF